MIINPDSQAESAALIHFIRVATLKEEKLFSRYLWDFM